MDEIRIIHLSDPHFGTITDGVEESLYASIRSLNPNMVLLTGDITQRARRAQFAAAKRFIKSLRPVPLIAVPGNHDIPLFNIGARLFDPYGGFRRLFRHRVEETHQIGDVQILGLNSTSRWRHIQGDFNIARLKRRLQSLPPAKIRIAAFHHPMDCNQGIDNKNLLRGREEAIKVFAEAEVDLILGGHIHDPFVSLSQARYPEIRRSMIIGVAGTCLSWRTREGAPNSFNLIEIRSEQDFHLSVTRYDLRPNRYFTPEAIHLFRRSASPDATPDWIRVD